MRKIALSLIICLALVSGVFVVGCSGNNNSLKLSQVRHAVNTVFNDLMEVDMTSAANASANSIQQSAAPAVKALSTAQEFDFNGYIKQKSLAMLSAPYIFVNDTDVNVKEGVIYKDSLKKPDAYLLMGNDRGEDTIIFEGVQYKTNKGQGKVEIESRLKLVNSNTGVYRPFNSLIIIVFNFTTDDFVLTMINQWECTDTTTWLYTYHGIETISATQNYRIEKQGGRIVLFEHLQVDTEKDNPINANQLTKELMLEYWEVSLINGVETNVQKGNDFTDDELATSIRILESRPVLNGILNNGKFDTTTRQDGWFIGKLDAFVGSFYN